MDWHGESRKTKWLYSVYAYRGLDTCCFYRDLSVCYGELVERILNSHAFGPNTDARDDRDGHSTFNNLGGYNHAVANKHPLNVIILHIVVT